MLWPTHPRQLQEMRRADSARGEDDLALGIRDLDPAAAGKNDAGRALATERDVTDQRIGDDFEVEPLQSRFQIGLSCAGAAPTAPRLLTPANAVAGAPRQVVYVRPIFDAEFPRGIDDGLAHRRPFGHWGSRQKPSRS